METDNNFIPTGPQFDAAFVQKHNATSDLYQAFKENVQIILCNRSSGDNRQIGHSPQDIARYIGQIKQISEQLLNAMEEEKHYLMSEVLCQWASQQQKLSIACIWTQQQNYSQLDVIDTQFEYFGELCAQTLTGLGYLTTKFPNVGFEVIHNRIKSLTHLFLFYSIIVSKQPPAVIVKCGEAENHRRSRWWFGTEIRILGGRAFGLNQSVDGAQVQCFLITDETAKQLRSNAYHEINDHEEFVIEPAIAPLSSIEIIKNRAMEMSDSPNIMSTSLVNEMMLCAKFDDMRVAKKEQLRRESVLLKRYHLCYDIRICTLHHHIELVGKKVSLPFAILVGPKQDVEARLFLERSFADFVRRPDGELPEFVGFHEMADALEMKFQAILEIPQKPTELPVPVPPRPFTLYSKQHLVTRLKPTAKGEISIENFLKMPVAEEFQIPKKSLTSQHSASTATTASTPHSYTGPQSQQSMECNIIDVSPNPNAIGDWKLIPFYEWFFKLAEMVNKHFLSLWNENLIFGFCGKEEAERLLTECQTSTLLIRFSDIEFAKIKISVRDRYGVFRHHWYDQSELQGRSLTTELLTNAKYRDVNCIYPNISLEWAIGSRERNLFSTMNAQQRKPRHLQPSPLYFDNQDHGPSNYP